MVALNGTHDCFYCGNAINWEAIFNMPYGVPIMMSGQKSEVVAVGSDQTNGEKRVEYDVTVFCQRCKVNNKFKVFV